MKAIIVQSVISTVYGILDDDGDVVHKEKVDIELSKLTDKTLSSVLEQVNKTRAELQQRIDSQTSNEVEQPTS